MRLLLAAIICLFSSSLVAPQAQAEGQGSHSSFSHFFQMRGTYYWLNYYESAHMLLVGSMDSSGNYYFDYLGVGSPYFFHMSRYQGRSYTTADKTLTCVSASFLLVAMMIENAPSAVQSDLYWAGSAQNAACSSGGGFTPVGPSL